MNVAELAEVDESAALSAAACLFRSLGDPARLAILRHLALGEHRVVDLTAHLGLAQSTVSAHLACLRDCGLVESRPQGRASLFSPHPRCGDPRRAGRGGATVGGHRRCGRAVSPLRRAGPAMTDDRRHTRACGPPPAGPAGSAAGRRPASATTFSKLWSR